MNLYFVLAIFFAIICFIETSSFKLKLATFYEDNVPTKGQIYVGLYGSGQERYFALNETIFHKRVHLEKESALLGDIESVSFRWDSESKKPLLFSYLIAESEINESFDVAIMNEYIESGSFKNFKILDKSRLPK